MGTTSDVKTTATTRRTVSGRATSATASKKKVVKDA